MTSYFDYLPSELIHQIMFYNINVPILADAFPHLKHIIYDQFIRQKNFKLYTELLNVSNKINIPMSYMIDLTVSLSFTLGSFNSNSFAKTINDSLKLAPSRDPYNKQEYERDYKKYLYDKRYKRVYNRIHKFPDNGKHVHQQYDLITFNLAFLRRYPRIYEYYYSNKDKFNRTFEQMISKFVFDNKLDPQDQDQRKYAKEQLEQDKVYFDTFKNVTPYQLYHAVNEYRSYNNFKAILDDLFLDESTIDDIIFLI